MNKKLKNIRLFLLAIGILSFGCTPEDADSPVPEDFFIKYYGTSETEVIVDIQAHPNGGYLILGSTTETTNGDARDILLIMTDDQGSQLWQHKINYTYNSLFTDNVERSVNGIDTPSEMIIYGDSKYVIIIGTTEFDLSDEPINGTRAFVSIVELSSDNASSVILSDNLVFPSVSGLNNGQAVLNENSFGASVLHPSKETGNNLVILGSSVVTETIKPGANLATDIQEIYLTKVELDLTDGTTSEDPSKWPQYFGFDGYDEGVRLIEDINGIYKVVANTDNNKDGSGGGLNIDYYGVTPEGDVSISSTFGFINKEGISADDVVTDLSISGDRVTILGNSTIGGVSNAFIFEINSTGSVIFKNDETVSDSTLFAGVTYGGNTGNSLVKLNSSEFMVVGQVLGYTDPLTNTNKQNDVLIYRIDQLGDVDNSSVNVFGGVGSDIGKAVIQNGDGSLMIGATMDFLGNTTMMSLIKTNSKGELAR